MGQTNLKQALERKFSLMAGEFKEKEREVARIQSLFEELPALSKRAERLRHLLSCAQELLTEIDPAWKPARVKPVVPNVHKAPVPMGEIAKGALATLRKAENPMTAREIAIEILYAHGITVYDKPTLTRVTNSVLSSLKKKDGLVVKSDDGYPFKWSIALRH